ncbi:MAG TPA: hypothetical protein VJB06_00560 [archaeon]|nr:hypothetical protein [archaeon]
MGSKIDNVNSNIDSLRKETQANFDRTDVKYDKISSSMTEIVKELKTGRK